LRTNRGVRVLQNPERNPKKKMLTSGERFNRGRRHFDTSSNFATNGSGVWGHGVALREKRGLYPEEQLTHGEGSLGRRVKEKLSRRVRRRNVTMPGLGGRKNNSGRGTSGTPRREGARQRNRKGQVRETVKVTLK